MNTLAWRSPISSRPSGVSRTSQRLRREPVSVTRVASPKLSDAQLLSELTSAYVDVRTSIQLALYGSAAKSADLMTLRGELRSRLDRLLEGLVSCSGEKDAIDALVPFVFFVDEQVEQALLAVSEPGSGTWPQLQRDLFSEGRAEGGDVFFERAEQLLAEETARPLVVSAYLFCLKANFRGRLADEPEEVVVRWVDALAALLPMRRKETALRASWHAQRPAPSYLGFALVVVIAWHFIVLVWCSLR